MNSRPRFLAALATICVGACMLPAAAGASTGATMPAGTLVPVGTNVTASNVGTITITDPRIGNITCSTMMIPAVLTINSATGGVQAKGNGAGGASGCLNGGRSITVTDITVSYLESTSAETGKAKGTFTLTVELPELTCKFSATGAPASYSGETGEVKFEKAALTVSPTACGSGAIDGEFELSTSFAGTILLM